MQTLESLYVTCYVTYDSSLYRKSSLLNNF